MRIYPSTPSNLEKASEFLRMGQLVALPTETVYGLAADATNDKAVAKIFALKNRPQFNPLIVHFHDLTSLEKEVELSPQMRQLAQTFSPGPLTLVLPRKKTSQISLLVSAGLDTLAVRIPGNEKTRRVIELAGCPLAAPSANPSECLSPTTAQHVADSFNKDPDLSMVLEGGPTPLGIESTIVYEGNGTLEILRPGALTQEKIEALVGPLRSPTSLKGSPRAPGQLKRHYAPSIPLRLEVLAPREDEAFLAFGDAIPEGAAETLNLSPKGSLEEAAANLFAMLRALDQKRYSGIGVMPLPERGLGVAINDRLRRAASPHCV